MNNIINSQYFMDIVAVIILLCVLGFLVYTKRIPQAKRIVLALVLQAESIYGAGTGEAKYASVIGLIYPKLPMIVRMFVPERVLNDWIEEAVNTLKQELQPTLTSTSNNVVDSVTQANTLVDTDAITKDVADKIISDNSKAIQ